MAKHAELEGLSESIAQGNGAIRLSGDKEEDLPKSRCSC